MPGLERLLRNLYGSTPQIDMDQQFTRSRVIRALTLDFAALADGMKRANVGLDSITFQASVEVREGRAVLRPTGQSFPIEGPPPADPGPAWRRMKVLDWGDPAKTRVAFVP